MAKITIAEPVHVAIVIDGEAVNLDLVAGDINVDQNVADILIAQGLATESTGKSSSGKKPSATIPAVEETISVESSEA